MVDFKALVPWKNIKQETPVTQGDYFDPIVSLRGEVDRMFDDFFSGIGSRSSRSSPSVWQDLTPTDDVAQTDKDVVITAELPGLSDKDLRWFSPATS